MNYKQTQLADKDGNLLMPVTTTNEILTSDGSNLEQEIRSLKLTPGYGIKIENGTISCSFEDRTEVKY